MPRGGEDVSSECRVFETDEFARALARLSASAAGFIRKKLVSYVYPQLRQEPYFGPNIKKRQGFSPVVWRYRIGRFRIFYQVDDAARTVFILTIDHRKDAYK